MPPLPGAGTGFQSFVNNELPPAIAGDWAGANIRASMPASPWQAIATPGGVLIGGIGWFSPATGYCSSYYQPSSFAGFVHRDLEGLLTTFLSAYGSSIVGGDMVSLQVTGDWWGLFASGATAGQKVYTNPSTGLLTSGATGGSVTASNPTGTVSGNVLTLTGSTTGTIAVGQVVTGGTLPAGTYVVSGSSLTWTLANYDGTVIPNNASAAAYAFYGIQETQFYVVQTIPVNATFTASLALPAAGVAFGVLTVTAVGGGVLVPGQFLSATGLAASANVQILQQLTGTTGSTGTYAVSNAETVGSTATFVGTQGQLGKISSLANWL